MKINEWIKKHFKEIVIGVIVSLITTFVINAIDMIKEVAPTAGSSIWRLLSNSFFSAAAKMSETSLTSFLFSFVVVLGISYVINVALKGFKVTKKSISECQAIIEKINCNDLVNVNTEEDTNKEITEEDVKTEAESVIKEGKKIRRFLIGALAFFVIYFSVIMAFDVFPHAMWAEYQNDLIKIAPYIEQQELDQIKSDWVCMQSKEDYDDIYSRINKIKEENDLP